MKIGCCSNMLARVTDQTGNEQIDRILRTGIDFLERIADAGFDYIELPLAQLMMLDEAAFEKVAARVHASGLACEVCNNFFPTTIRLTGVHVDEEEIDEYVTAALHRARTIGAGIVVFGSGPAKNVPYGFPLEEGYHQVVSMLKRINPIAQREQVTIVIEPLRRQECNLINTYAEGCQLARDVDGSHIQVLVDYYHLATEREPARNIMEGRRYLRHVHYARLAGRGFPSTIDDTLNEEFFQALREIGYQGRMSLEAYTDHFDREARVALEFLRAWTSPSMTAGET